VTKRLVATSSRNKVVASVLRSFVDFQITDRQNVDINYKPTLIWLSLRGLSGRARERSHFVDNLTVGNLDVDIATLH
jgi:hypothetical protein